MLEGILLGLGVFYWLGLTEKSEYCLGQYELHLGGSSILMSLVVPDFSNLELTVGVWGLLVGLISLEFA